MTPRPRVLVAQIMHETNTFSRLRTGIDDYARRYLHIGADVRPALAGTRTEIGGHIDAAEAHGWDLVMPIAANATPSGPVTEEAWARLSGTVLDAARRGGIDAVALALHGAMATESEEDAEGALLAALREILGPDVPVAITLDLHANVSDRMAALADIVVAYRTYPHVDQYERARQAADLLAEALAGRTAPACLVRRPPMLYGANFGRTESGLMATLLEAAADHETEDGILAVSVHAGFAHADAWATGPSVAVTHDGPGAARRAAEIADSLCATIWAGRQEATAEGLSLADAMALARTHDGGKGPLVLADYTDNPGGGGYGDTTNLLRAMIEAGVDDAAFATIADPISAAAGHAAGIGARLRLPLGGHTDPAQGPPIDCEGSVVSLSDGAFVYDGPMWAGVAGAMGPSMVFETGGILVVVASNRLQVTDRQFFLSQGIDPAARRVLALKSIHHFRAAFAPVAGRIALVEAGGLVSTDFAARAWHRLRRPIWPLDPDPR